MRFVKSFNKAIIQLTRHPVYRTVVGTLPPVVAILAISARVNGRSWREAFPVAMVQLSRSAPFHAACSAFALMAIVSAGKHCVQTTKETR